MSSMVLSGSHHDRMEPDQADELIRRGAFHFGAGDLTIIEMWNVFHGNLYDLCRECPMTDELVALFESLERWEIAVGADRVLAVDDARSVARRLGSADPSQP